MLDNITREEIMEIKPYIPGKPISEVKRELGLERVIKLASNENSLGPAPDVIDRMQEAVKKVGLYPDGNAYRLRDKLSKKLGVNGGELIFGNGSDELLVILGQTFINSGDEVIVGETTFSEYGFATKLMGAEMIKVPFKDYTHNLKGMVDAITDKTKMIFVCNPNNPTGTIVTREEVDTFLKEVPDDIIVVFDEAYYEYVTSKDYPETIDYLEEYDNLVILRTFSKAYALAGLRIGYGIANKELISYLERARQPFNLGLVAQEAALAALDAKDHLEKSLEYNRQGKEYLYQAFEDLGLNYIPTETNFILVDVEEDCDQVFKDMMKQGIIIRSMSSYDYKKKIRITVGLPEENKEMIKVLKDVL